MILNYSWILLSQYWWTRKKYHPSWTYFHIPTWKKWKKTKENSRFYVCYLFVLTEIANTHGNLIMVSILKYTKVGFTPRMKWTDQKVLPDGHLVLAFMNAILVSHSWYITSPCVIQPPSLNSTNQFRTSRASVTCACNAGIRLGQQLFITWWHKSLIRFSLCFDSIL